MTVHKMMLINHISDPFGTYFNLKKTILKTVLQHLEHYINNCPTRCNNMQSVFYFAAVSLYMFWVPLCPSSGVHKTVVTATGTSHMIVQLLHSDVAKLGMR